MNYLIETEIPPLYRDLSIDKLIGGKGFGIENLEEVKQKVSQYLNDPDLEKKGNNLYVYSVENGTGKSSLAYYILSEIHKPRLKFSQPSSTESIENYLKDLQGRVETTPVVAVKLANYLKFCNDPYGQESRNAKKQVEFAPFLLLDDVSPWALPANLQKDKLELILLMMYRREHLLPTIITSNLIPTEFDKLFGATVTSKVLENFSYIQIHSGDIRGIVYPDNLNGVIGL